MKENRDNQMPVQYQPGKNKKSIWTTVREILQSDVVWFSVALGCILGVVLFYFQGLQPLLLRYYVVETKSNLVALEDKFVNQVDSVKNLQPKFTDSFDYSLGDLCSDQPRYTGYTTDADELDRLQVNLLNSPKPTVIKSTATLNEVKKEYNRIYDKYSDSMDKVRELASGFTGIPSYLNYMNAWIEGCQTLEESKGLNADVAKACKTIQDARASFDTSTKPFFWNEVMSQHDKGLEMCKNSSSLPTTGYYSGFSSYKLDWLSQFSKIRQYVPDFYTQLEPLNGIVTDFADAYSRSDSELLAILESRKSLGGMWYVLNYKDKSY